MTYTNPTSGSLGTRMLSASRATRESYQARHDSFEPGGSVALLLEAAKDLLSAIGVNHRQRIEALADAIAAVEELGA